MVLLLREGDELVVTAIAGEIDARPGRRARADRGLGDRRGAPDTTAGAAVADVPSRLRFALGERVDATDGPARAAAVPRAGAGRARRVRPASGGPGFSAEDERLMEAFAASAATAVATAQNVAPARRLRAASRRPRPSAGAGRASCTTRPCRSSRRSRSRWPAHAGVTRAGGRVVDARRRRGADRLHHPRPARDHHRPAARRPRRPRRRAGRRGARRAGEGRGRRSTSPLDVDLAFEAGRSAHAARARDRARGLPAGAGGAHERRPARRGVPHQHRHRRARRSADPHHPRRRERASTRSTTTPGSA